MTTRTKWIIGIIVILVIIMGIFVGTKIIKNNTEEVFSNTLNETNSDVFDKYANTEINETNESLNEVNENEIEDNAVENNIAENEIPEVNTTKEEENTIVGKEEKETEQEIKNSQSSEKTQKITEKKAIELVKQTWGEDDSVYYTIANKDDKNYYVSVNDNSTTSVLAWYSVDIESGTVTEN